MTVEFKDGANLVKQLNKTQTDGAFSATVGTVANDAITTVKIKDANVTTAKIKDANVTSAKILADNVTTVKILDANVTLAKLATTAKKQVLSYQVEDLAANADITTTAMFEAPAGVVCTITSAKVISQGTAAGIEDGNTCVVVLLKGANAISTLTYNTGNAFPAVNVSDAFAALDATYKVVAAGEKIHFTVTNGTTANPPAFMLQVEYTIADA